jgi:hypothetical protein
MCLDIYLQVLFGYALKIFGENVNGVYHALTKERNLQNNKAYVAGSD